MSSADVGDRSLSALPSGWRRSRLKFDANVKGRIGWHGLTAADHQDDGKILVTGTDFDHGRVDWAGCKRVSDDIYQRDRFIQLRSGDLLVTKDGSIGKVAHIENLPEPATLNSGIFVVRPNSDTLRPRFFYWVLNSEIFSRFVAFMSSGSTIEHLYQEVFVNMPYAVPPASEQKAIAEYLDTGTARLDALIGKKRRLIVLAKERFEAWRESVLVHAPGTTWTPLHHLTDPYRPIVYGIVQAGEEVPDGIPYIKTGDLADFQAERLSRTSHEIDAAYRRARVVPGDIVIAMRASIGLPIIVPPNLPVANLTQGTARIAPRRGIDLHWLFQVLRCRTVQDECSDRAVGATFRTLNIWDLRRLKIPTPSLETQQTLAISLDAAEARLASLISRLERQIVLLGEHRAALITSAVTGELDIGGAA